MKYSNIPNSIKILVLILVLIAAYYTVGTYWVGLIFFILGAIELLARAKRQDRN